MISGLATGAPARREAPEACYDGTRLMVGYVDRVEGDSSGMDPADHPRFAKSLRCGTNVAVVGVRAAWWRPCGLFYSQGIFTVLQYSSQLSPKVFDSSASSAGANIRDPMYRMMPIPAPSHVLQMKPIHGSTRRATPV